VSVEANMRKTSSPAPCIWKHSLSRFPKAHVRTSRSGEGISDEKLERFEKFKVLSICAVIWGRLTNFIVIRILSAASNAMPCTMERYIPSLDGLCPQLMSQSESSESQLNIPQRHSRHPVARKNSRKQHHGEH
jgi:hypothetical protein